MNETPSYLLPQDRCQPQTILHGSEGLDGNCTQASVATIMGIPLSEVPDFANLTKDAGVFWEMFETWFLSKGYQAVMQHGDRVYDGLYLASGPTSRGHYHMVVYRAGSLVWDPHPSKEGISEVAYTWVVVPLDPAKAA